MLRASKLSAHGFLHGFSMRHARQGGVSTPPFASSNLGSAVGNAPACVLDDTRRVAAAMGVKPERLYLVKQVHGRDVRCVRADDAPEGVGAESADALVTQVHGVAIAVRTADCVPVLLVDLHTRTVAAVHVGWRGAVAGIVPNSVAALREQAGSRARVLAAIFPHIGPCCFEVGDDIAAQIAGAVLGAQPTATVIRRAAGRKPHADLAAVVIAQLRASEVDAADIEQVAGCTRCDAARFFSYRRDGVGAGRHLTTIVGG